MRTPGTDGAQGSVHNAQRLREPRFLVEAAPTADERIMLTGNVQYWESRGLRRARAGSERCSDWLMQTADRTTTFNLWTEPLPSWSWRLRATPG